MIVIVAHLNVLTKRWALVHALSGARALRSSAARAAHRG